MALDLITVSQAAESLSLTPARIHAFIRDKRLKAENLGGRYVIHKAELERFRHVPRLTGQPGQKKYRRRKSG